MVVNLVQVLVKHGVIVHLAPDGGASQDVFLSVVLGERGLAAETLPAAFDGASVRAFARVDAAVTGQGRAVTESLLAIGLLAHVGAFAGVGALMHSQCGALDEGLCASVFLADEGSFVGVDASMACQVRATRECFATVDPGAAEWPRILLMPLRMDEFEDVHLGRGTCKGRNG